MNKEDRFDCIVGLIYDTVNDSALDTAGADAVMQAIRAELDEPDEPHEPHHTGESPGGVDSLMRRLAPHIERSGRLRSRIRQLEHRQSSSRSSWPTCRLVWCGWAQACKW